MAQATWGLPQLMQSLSQVKSASAQFTETKRIAILTTELRATGTLSYTAPDQMEKITHAPTPERFVLAGDQVTITGQDNQPHIIHLAEAPQLAGLTEGIVGTLAGNLPLLIQFYDLQLSGGPAFWQLILQPKDADTRRMIAWIAIRGTGNRIQTIETESANGDHSNMSIDETVSDAR
jgi:outer membrane lipoprotein-sorting protein